MTPITPGTDVPGLDSSRKSPEKPEDQQEIGDVRVRKRANRGIQWAARLGQEREVRANGVAGRTRLEQEGKMNHVATPG